jgi:isoquinoline 1-oxidoreductase subunit beta
MGKLRTFTRRSFLVGSVAVAGGVAFGTYQVMRDPKAPGIDTEGVVLNPWIVIDARGVTVIVPRAEMGQGVQTTLAALAAEELEVPLDQIRVEHGPPGEAYANGALMVGREYGAGPPSRIGGAVMGQLPKILGLQVTGGSTSTVDAFDKMRHAGAGAREVLMRAASERLGLGLDQLRAEAGEIVTTDGQRLAYSALAEDAARLVPPEAPRLKRPEDWVLLGKSQPRLDQVPKATGTASFATDIRLPGMRFATVRRNPHQGGEMRGFDSGAAESMAGVEAVIDIGDGIAVVASNTWLAMQAAEAVEVDWGPAPYPETTDAVFERIAQAFDEKPNITARETGDVGSGGEIAADYHAPYLAHATMEPMTATALYRDGAVELWAGNQAPIMLQNDTAKALDIKPEAVTVHTTIMGGGFGRRANVEFGVIAARIAQALPGVPVAVTWSREEDMRHDHYRPGALARMSATLEDGRIARLSADLASPSIMGQTIGGMLGLSYTPPDRTITEGAGDQPYAIENIRVRGFAADVAIPVGYWRAVGNSQNAFFWESFIDELAHAAGADPVAFRLAHIRPEHGPSADVLEKVAEISVWGAAKPANVGRGVAFTHSFGTPVAEVVEVVEEDGLIRLARCWIAADPGLVLDPANVEAQLTGGAVFGFSAAIHGEITFEGGAVVEGNFPDYEALRMASCPRFEVALLSTGDRPQGVGEPGTPPAAPALANALYDLTGKRARRLPLWREFDFAS